MLLIYYMDLFQQLWSWYGLQYAKKDVWTFTESVVLGKPVQSMQANPKQLFPFLYIFSVLSNSTLAQNLVQS